MVFVTAGEGGGTGTGGAPVDRQHRPQARRAHHRRGDPAVLASRASGARRRPTTASRRCAAECDTLIVIPNDRLLQIGDRSVSVMDAFRSADQVLLSGVQGITDLITTPGLINLDFADVKSVMSGAGSALMGIGAARGDNRAVEAPPRWPSPARCSRPAWTAPAACCCPSPAGRTSACSRSTTPLSWSPTRPHPDANIIFGAVIDDTLGDEVKVTVIAAGFDSGQPPCAYEIASTSGDRTATWSRTRCPNLRGTDGADAGMATSVVWHGRAPLG